MLKADLHVHTEYSFDCESKLERIIERCQKLGINCIAVADHGTAEGALKLQEMAPFTVIVAEEILTPHGEVMGMFLKETVPTKIPVEQAIAEIRAQDGLVCIPHPFERIRHSALEREVVEQIIEHIDVIEAFNARSPFSGSANRAREFAEQHGFVESAGSDAHSVQEIGNAYVEMPEFEDKEGFLKSLAQGTINGHRTSALNYLNCAWIKLKKRNRR